MSIIQKKAMEKEKIKDIPQKNKELEDDKPDSVSYTHLTLPTTG